MRRLHKVVLVVAVLLFAADAAAQYDSDNLPIVNYTYDGPPDAVWGYVLAAKQATPEAGEALTPETMVEIDQDGYLTLMVPSGRTRTVQGYYSDMAWVLISCPGGDCGRTASLHGGEALGDALIESLLALVDLNETSDEAWLGVRAPCDSEPIDSAVADAISTANKRFCIAPGEVPGFYTMEPSRVDERFIIRRITDQFGFHSTLWPAESDRLPWPTQWRSPEDGRYSWTRGNCNPFIVWIRVVEDAPDDPLQRAAHYNNLGCKAQALALFQSALPLPTPVR